MASGPPEYESVNYDEESLRAMAGGTTQSSVSEMETDRPRRRRRRKKVPVEEEK